MTPYFSQIIHMYKYRITIGLAQCTKVTARKMLPLLFVALLVAATSAQVQEGDVRFYLGVSRLQIQASAAVLGSTSEVKILSHGWQDSINAVWYPNTTNQFAIRGLPNVIAIDWSPHSNGLYTTAVNRLNAVGGLVATFIIDLSQNQNVPLSNFHLIGHSLGAHLFGFAGQQVLSRTGQRIGRITGLDPAGPSFEGAAVNNRLSPDDALFVDIIHTDSTSAGFRGSLGHADFRPNGGVSRQPGCGILQLGCSHNRAPILFADSINSFSLIGVDCPNVNDFNAGRCSNNQRALLGENVDRSARGNFFLTTRALAPFGLG